MPLQGLFLDMYGTLTGGDRAAVESVCAQIIADHGVPMTAHALAVEWGNRFFAAIETANGSAFRTLFDLELDTLDETLTAHGARIDPMPYARALQAYWKAPPLHDEVLDAVARFCVPVCIVSNADRDDLVSALGRHGLGDIPFVTSECARSYKPDAGVFREALSRMGWRASDVMHVGDSLYSDVGGAKPLGILTGWVCREGRIHDVGAERPDHVFRNLRELADWLADGQGGRG